MAHDLLNWQAARPDTSVYGHWVLDLEQPLIHVRRFKQQVRQPEDSGRPDINDKGVLGDVHGTNEIDTLEKAWRQINNYGSVPGKHEDILKKTCAVIISDKEGNEKARKGVEGTDEAVEQSEKGADRVLWCFASGESGEKGYDTGGLQELDPLDAIDPKQLFHCATHGHDFTCLRAESPAKSDLEDASGQQTRTGNEPGLDREPCRDLQWKPDTRLREVWTYLSWALVECMAWSRGFRIVMQPSSTLRSYPEYHSSLYPMTYNRLLLNIKHISHTNSYVEQVKSTEANIFKPSEQSSSLCILRPIDMRAIFLGPYSPNETQAAHLHNSLQTTFGTGWTTSKQGRELTAHLERKCYHDWSVYWVPLLSPDQDSPTEWRKGKGILTVWPTHLAHALAEPRVQPSPRPSAPPVIMDETMSEDLLHSAHELYSHLTSEQETQLSLTNTAVQQVQTQAAISPESPMTRDEPGNDSKSDMDDLFSDHSDDQPKEVEHSAPDGEQESEGEFIMELLSEIDDDEGQKMDVDKDFEMRSPSNREDEEIGGEGEITQITEDDFNFFDSPATEQVSATPQLEQLIQTPDIFADVQTEEQQVDPKESEASVAEVSTEAVEVNHDQSAISGSMAADRPDELPSGGSTAENESPEKALFSRQPALDGDVRRSKDPLVPFGFEPIPLWSNTSEHSFTYAPPSPAATPEALRSDLVERLRGSNKSKEYDYTADWDIESRSSTSDSDTGDSIGAPPTPESLMYDDDDISSMTSPSISANKENDEITWEGKKCLVGEWLIVSSHGHTLDDMAISWQSNWTDSSQPIPSGSTGEITKETSLDMSRLDGLNCDWIAEQIIANRSFRDHIRSACAFRVHETSTTRGIGHRRLTIFGDGTDFASMLNVHGDDRRDEVVKNVQSLSPCQVDVGYAGQALSLAAAGLRYWHQLGLQPVAGPKDISILVICDVADGVQHAMKDFLEQIQATYNDCGLGTIHIGEASAAVGGIIALPAHGFPDTLNALLSRHHEDTVIFILSPSLTTSTSLQNSLKSTFPSKASSAFDRKSIYHILDSSHLYAHDLTNIAFEIYDRLPRSVHPISVRGLPLEQSPKILSYPHFTISPDASPRPELTLAWPLKSYDVLNRWKMVHGTYIYDRESKMTVAMALDSTGQTWETKTWLNVASLGKMVNNVWRFFRRCAGDIATEYRLGICCSPSTSFEEIQQWRKLLNDPGIPTTLLYLEPSAPPDPTYAAPRPISNIPPATFVDPSTRLIDDTLNAKYAALTAKIPFNLHLSQSPDSTEDCYPVSSFLVNIANGAASGHSTSLLHVILHEAPLGRKDEGINDLFAKEFYRLIVLSRLRFKFETNLPAHTYGVQTVLNCLKGITAQ